MILRLTPKSKKNKLSSDDLRVYLTGSNGFIGSNLLSYFSEIDIIEVQRSENHIDLVHDKKNILIWAGEPSNIRKVNDGAFEEQEILTDRLSKLVNLPFDQIIYLSSIYTYKRTDFKEIYNENDLVDTKNFYSKGKVQREKLVLKKRQGCVLRLSNIYGLGMHDNIFEDIRNEFKKKKDTMNIRNLKSKLDLIYIDDLLECINKSMEMGITGLYNLCSNKETTPLVILDTIFSLLGTSRNIVETHPDIIGYLIGDNTKIRSELDWVPSHTLEEGLTKLINKGYFYG